MRKFSIYGLALIGLLSLFSCMEDSPQIPLGEFEKGILIMNEGAFGANDGEVYHYDPATGTIQQNVFESKNGRPFAGLLQDMVASEGRLYLVANTGKVEVVGLKDFTSRGAVTSGLDISRSLVIANQKMYISDWGPYDANFNNPNSYIAIVNHLDGGTVSKKIPVSTRPEGMFVAGNQLLIGCSDAKKLEVVSLATDELVKTIALEGMPTRFFESEGKLYLFARDSEKVYFHEINRNNIEIINTVSVSLARATSNFALTDSGELLVITSTGWPSYNDAVAKVKVATGEVISAELFTGSGFYGIGYHVDRKEIYIADNNAFQGNGTVIVLDQSGIQKKTIPAGRGPSGFLMR
ncbi:YncE family protein [Cecembia calidifontis]|jgi:DNA-binding beta-propeller fold protein YncE|uniref:YVTN family beta-propeller protein n=1 Tax=Cecembia calidifontis TaxID=1187080 RepID=A0A4Q7PCT1_9BACT|nr:DUF5074 domain-containing protein [Cecembia calidifontis]RZS96602.1 hypothetical protein BC751_2182 [Cecembia calidifontis]